MQRKPGGKRTSSDPPPQTQFFMVRVHALRERERVASLAPQRAKTSEPEGPLDSAVRLEQLRDRSVPEGRASVLGSEDSSTVRPPVWFRFERSRAVIALLAIS